MRRAAGPARHAVWLPVGILWLVAASVLIGGSMVDAKEASFSRAYVCLVCEEPGITLAEAERIRISEQEKENGMEFTAWSEKKRVTIQSADRYRSANTNVVEINGSSELLFPGGKILRAEDTGSCLIGEETAQELFGSSHVEGAGILYGDRPLTVRGVIASPGTLLVVEAEGPDSRFDRISLKPSPGIAATPCAERFAAAYGLSARQMRFDLFSKDRLLELIPGKWSDISGWRQSMKLFGGDVSTLLVTEKSSAEERYLLLYAKSAVWMASGLFCLYTGCVTIRSHVRFC